jgi:hypothetical protein
MDSIASGSGTPANRKLYVYLMGAEIVLFLLMCLEYDHRGGLHGDGSGVLLIILMATQLPGILASVLTSYFFTGPGRSATLESMSSAVILITILIVQLLLAFGLATAVRRVRERRIGGG